MNSATQAGFGNPLTDVIVNTTNDWQTLATITAKAIKQNNNDPAAVLLSIKDTTNDALFQFGGTAQHPLTSSTTAPASVFITGAAAVKALRLKSAVDGNAAAVSVTIFY